ncbi:olfactory receptor 5AP2-like [Phyllobates terribilis]|uniref:olfactory receptor 5AP2-like n=1 Tax=Phyllobates terribilis TaxID=111132 RepID=UPI003CCAB74D
MENISLAITDLILMGLVEISNFKYLFSLVIGVVYVMAIVLCFTIVFLTYMEESLHEPMYIFISNLMFNGIYGTTSIMPKLIIDLLTGCYTVPYTRCLAQSFFVQSYPSVEIFTFTAMAYDRYLAVEHPLRYPMLMTNKKAQNILLEIWIYVLSGICVIVILATRQTLCGVMINSMMCETISLTHLACGDTTLSVVFGFTWTSIMVVSCVLVVMYCYIRTFIVCLQISQEAYQKAIHTLVTHIIAFTAFLVSILFFVFRYKLKGELLSVVSNIVISLTGAFSSTLNPIIYGIRTEALRTKILQKLHNKKK